MFDFLIGILRWKKTQLVMENLRLKWIEGKLLAEEVKALEEENKRLKEGIEALLRLRGGVAVLPSPVEVEKREEKREEKKEGKGTRWTEEERERIRDWIKARVSPLMVYERYDGRPVRREGTCYKALCPFHNDKNPSLAIYDDGFYCYAGCEFEVGKERERRGDIFAFVQKWVLEKEGKRINFDEAMERIIKDFSLALPQKSPVEASQRGGKREGIGKSIVSFSEASPGGNGGEKSGVLEGREGEGRKREGGWRGLTMRQYKEYCRIISEEIEGMPWRDYFNGWGQILEGLWFPKEEKFKSIAEPFSGYEEAIRRGEAVPCIRFEVWDLNENGEIDYFPERINLRHSVPGGFYYGKGTPSPIYGLHLFLSDMDRPILTCEGASDGFLSLLLRFIPFALPGKGSWKKAVEYLPIIFERYGKREVYILVEPDAREEMAKFYGELKRRGIKARAFLLEPFKDLRDWWCAFVEEKEREPRPEDFFEFLNLKGGDF
jgi:hypothetical protein